MVAVLPWWDLHRAITFPGPLCRSLWLPIKLTNAWRAHAGMNSALSTTDLVIYFSWKSTATLSFLGLRHLSCCRRPRLLYPSAALTATASVRPCEWGWRQGTEGLWQRKGDQVGGEKRPQVKLLERRLHSQHKTNPLFVCFQFCAVFLIGFLWSLLPVTKYVDLDSLQIRAVDMFKVLPITLLLVLLEIMNLPVPTGVTHHTHVPAPLSASASATATPRPFPCSCLLANRAGMSS